MLPNHLRSGSILAGSVGVSYIFFLQITKSSHVGFIAVHVDALDSGSISVERIGVLFGAIWISGGPTLPQHILLS